MLPVPTNLSEATDPIRRPRDVAKILNISKQGVYDLIQTQKLRAIKISQKGYGIYSSEIDRYLVNLNPIAQVNVRPEPQHLWFYNSESTTAISGTVLTSSPRHIEFLDDNNKIFVHGKYKHNKYLTNPNFEEIKLGDSVTLIPYQDNVIDVVVSND